MDDLLQALQAQLQGLPQPQYSTTDVFRMQQEALMGANRGQRLRERAQPDRTGMFGAFVNSMDSQRAGEAEQAALEQLVKAMEAQSGIGQYEKQVSDIQARIADIEKYGRELSMYEAKKDIDQDYAKPDKRSTQVITRTMPDGSSQQFLIDSQTGEEIRAFDPSAPKKPEGGGFDEETKLRKEFLDITSDFQKQTDSYGRVLQSVKTPSPAGDLALIFNYMKILDPGSVVRESEFETAARSGAYGERIKAAVNRTLNGQRLSDEMRLDFLNRAGMLYGDAVNLYGQRKDQYRGLAERYGFDPGKIYIDRAEHQVQGADELEIMAQEAIAAGADPEAVRQRMEQIRGSRQQ